MSKLFQMFPIVKCANLKKLTFVFLVLSLSFCKNSREEKLSWQADFKLTTDFFPRNNFMGICSGGQNEEFIFYADPITLKMVYFKDFTDSLRHSIPLDQVQNQLGYVVGMHVISMDNLYFFGYDKAVLINRQGEVKRIIELNKLSNSNYEFFKYPSQPNYQFAAVSNLLGIAQLHEEPEIDSSKGIYNEIDIQKWYAEKRMQEYIGARLVYMGVKDSLEMMAKGFYQRFSKEPFQPSELPMYYSIGDTTFISTSYSQYAFLYSSEKGEIIDSVFLDIQAGFIKRPVLAVNEENLERINRPVNYGEFTHLFAVFSSANKRQFFFIVKHESDQQDIATVLVFDENLKQINQVTLPKDEKYFYLGTVYSNKRGLLIPKYDETKSEFTYYSLSAI